MPQIQPTDLCPYESGQGASGCCFFGGRAEPREADTRPKPPRTGYAHSACYAGALHDCSHDISGEHYLSENVLRELSEPCVVVSGFPWQKAERQRVGVSALEANILCGRHNSVLSRLDAQAGRFFRTVRGIQESLQAGDGTQRVSLFPGVDVERWLRKALMGLCGAGAARTPDGIPIPWVPPEIWLRVLFGQYAFPETWGLYVQGRLGAAQMFDPGHIRIAPLTNKPDEISGVLVEMVGISFALATRHSSRRAGAIDDHSIYRPGELKFVDAPSGTERSLCFAWRGPYTTQVVLNWDRSAVLAAS